MKLLYFILAGLLVGFFVRLIGSTVHISWPEKPVKKQVIVVAEPLPPIQELPTQIRPARVRSMYASGWYPMASSSAGAWVYVSDPKELE